MENKTIEESIITALDGTDAEQVKYIPYILQDFWELGTPSDDIIEIIKKFKTNYSNLAVLDIGCGKGAVSINIALKLKCKCFGIDAMEEFVFYSAGKAEELLVNGLCSFELNDIRTRLKTLPRYDVIILGAIGAVFGNYYETLTVLKRHLNKDGIVIINDAYTEDGCNEDYHPDIERIGGIHRQTEKAGMELIDIIADDAGGELSDEFKTELENITKRCNELIKQFPQDKDLFLRFIKKQKREYESLSSEITPAIFVFKQKGENL